MKNKLYEFDSTENNKVLKQRTRKVLNNMNRNTITRVIRAVYEKCERVIERDDSHFEPSFVELSN